VGVPCVTAHQAAQLQVDLTKATLTSAAVVRDLEQQLQRA
jgi:hypothetical protein